MKAVLTTFPVLLLVAGCAGAAVRAAPPDPPASSGPACGRPAGNRVWNVHDSASLLTVLAKVDPGDSIVLADGSYAGHFQATRPGTRQRPIRLCGQQAASLTGGRTGYVLQLQQANWWVVSGLRIEGGEKGIVLDDTSNTTLTDLTVTGTGQEAVHLRAGSSHNTLSGLRISRTGLKNPAFGEGVYVGSAKENWCRYTECGPDASDANTIEGVVFGPDVRAENIDVKEGTTGGLIARNTFSGVGATSADSWVDIKGNGWLTRDNTGRSAARDGAQVHVQLPGWGQNNVFSHNVFAVMAPGYGVRVQSEALGTVIACSNSAPGAASGLSNETCS